MQSIFFLNKRSFFISLSFCTLVFSHAFAYNQNSQYSKQLAQANISSSSVALEKSQLKDSKPQNSLTQKQAKTLVIIGDSLTEGYGVSKENAFPSVLETKLKQVKVINSGISGATTASAKGRVQWILKSKPQVVMLILGANDGLRGLKVSESKKNLSEAIQLLKANNIKVILGGIYMPPNYGKEYTQEFKKMYQDLARENKVHLVPFILESVAGDPKYNLPDGIHPNEEGHKLIAENVYKSIEKIL